MGFYLFDLLVYSEAVFLSVSCDVVFLPVRMRNPQKVRAHLIENPRTKDIVFMFSELDWN